jgi:hypothetical protein
MHLQHVKKIYMVYSRFNDPSCDRKIKEASDRIQQAIADLEYQVDVRHVKINEKDFEGSFSALARVHDQEKDTVIVTDLTAGKRIVSYIAFYVHCYSKHKLRDGSKMMYFFEGSESPVEMPPIIVDRMGSKVEMFLSDLSRYNDASRSIEPGDTSFPSSLMKWLGLHGSNRYKEPTMYRYKRELRDRGFVEPGTNEITMKGRMYLITT